MSPARVSQMIKEGKIDQHALIGSGRSAKINLEKAREQVRLRTDLGQAQGNGFDTLLSDPEDGKADSLDFGAVAGGADQPSEETTSSRPPLKSREQDYREERELLRLKADRRKDAREQEDELLRQGVLMKTDDAVSEMQAIVGQIYDVLSGHPDRLGDLLAAEFEITDKRRLIFFLRNTYRDLKQHISEELERRAENEPDHVSADLLTSGPDDDAEMGQRDQMAVPSSVEDHQAETESGSQSMGA